MPRGSSANDNLAAFFRSVNSIGDQIRQDLLQFAFNCGNSEVRLNSPLKVYSFVLAFALIHGQHILDDLFNGQKYRLGIIAIETKSLLGYVSNSYKFPV